MLELLKTNRFQQIGDPDSCTGWTLCVNGTPMPRECAPGTRFNRDRGGCDLEENVPCATATCEQIEAEIGLAPSPDSCTAYHYCFNRRKVMRGECAPGLSFDTVTKGCVVIGQGTCFPGTNVQQPVRRFY